MTKTVLIVEDEADVRIFLSTVLMANGYRALVASDAETGLELARAERPDLISLDVMMPKQSGLSLYLELCRDTDLARIPVVLVTGLAQHGQFNFRDQVPDTSVPEPARVLEKPVTAPQYLELVASLTTSSDSENQGEGNG
ncbi:MAG: response regulator [bacterium]